MATTSQAQRVCESMLRTVMTADDEFGATMQLLAERGVLDDTLVILSSDNGFSWGEHGRMSKFVPYEPSMRVPLLVRWPGHIAAGTDATRLVSYVDILPTILQAANVTLPAGAPPLDGESLLAPEQSNDPVRRAPQRPGRARGQYLADGAHGERPSTSRTTTPPARWSSASTTT